MTAAGGRWANINEMEDSLTLEELYALHTAMFRIEHRRNKFTAALKGVNLDEEEDKAKFEEIRQQADSILNEQARETGTDSKAEWTNEMMGIQVDTEEEIYN